MNSAYFDNLDLIASSTRIRSVWFFGDFGGDFRIAMGPLLFCTRSLIKRAGDFASSDSPPWKKGRRIERRGRERPTKLLGGLAARKWGRSRPFWCFFHGDIPLHWACISHSAKKLLAPQVEELGEDEAEVCSSYVLHLFSSGSCSGTATRQSTSVTKCTLVWRLLPRNSWRMSVSVTRPTFHARRDARSAPRRIGYWPGCGKSSRLRSEMCTGRGPRPCGFGSSGKAPLMCQTRVGLPQSN